MSKYSLNAMSACSNHNAFPITIASKNRFPLLTEEDFFGVYEKVNVSFSSWVSDIGNSELSARTNAD